MPEDFETDDMTSEAPIAPPPKGKSKLLVFGVPFILIQAVVAYFLVMKFLYPEMPDPEAPEEEVQEEVVKKGETPAGVPFLIENLTINTREGKRSHFVVVSVTFECEDEAVATELTARDSQVRDLVAATIGSLEWEQVTSVAYREDSLKPFLKNEVNSILFPVETTVTNIYFPQYIIQ